MAVKVIFPAADRCCLPQWKFLYCRTSGGVVNIGDLHAMLMESVKMVHQVQLVRYPSLFTLQEWSIEDIYYSGSAANLVFSKL